MFVWEFVSYKLTPNLLQKTQNWPGFMMKWWRFKSHIFPILWITRVQCTGWCHTKRCVVKESMLLFNRIILDKSRSTSFVSWSFVTRLVSNCTLQIGPQTYMNYKQSCVDLLFGEVFFTRQLDLESNNTSCITLLNEAWSYLFTRVWKNSKYLSVLISSGKWVLRRSILHFKYFVEQTLFFMLLCYI